MGAVKKTLWETLILGTLGILVAVSANFVRASGTIKFTKNYFDKGFDQVERLIPQPGTDSNASQSATAPSPNAADEDIRRAKVQHQHRPVHF